LVSFLLKKLKIFFFQVEGSFDVTSGSSLLEGLWKSRYPWKGLWKVLEC